MHRQVNSKRHKHSSSGAGTKVAKISTESKKMQWQDEEISSDDDEGSPMQSDNEESDAQGNDESAEAKRFRLAKQYLQQMGNTGDDEDSADDQSAEAAISNKLKTDRLRSKGALYEDLSVTFAKVDLDSCTRKELSGHQGPLTCIALSKDEQHAFTGSKDNSVVKWDIETGAKTELKKKWDRKTSPAGQQSHHGEILAVAVTHDGRYVVSGARDSIIRVFDSRVQYAQVQELKGHRDAVTSLSFRMDTYTLFSGSLDRCLKHWDLNDMAYIETMFGHQDCVYSVDCWTKEKPLSTSSDRTLRLWKVAEETHLVFRGHKGSIDSAQYLTDNSFVSAGQDGTLCLWKDGQKTPVRSVHAAHGSQSITGASGPANWISSLASVKMSNVVASGSCDGFVRLWTANAEERQLLPLCAVPVLPGFVNALALSPRLLVAAGGKEHRLGRWWNVKGSNNKLTIVRFDSLLDQGDEASSGSADDDESGSEGDSADNSDVIDDDDDDNSGEYSED